MRTLRSAFLSTLALACLAAPAHAQDGGLRMQPCPSGGMPPGALCGTLRVPENRDAPGGRTIGLNVVVLPAKSARRAADAVTFLAGGPGQAVTPMAGYVAQMYAPLRETRDILLVDQRGTGGSHPLSCTFRQGDDPQSLVGDFLPPDAVRRCREELSARADLSRYTMPEAARDLDAVRAALGYEQLNLQGGSYGTRAAQVYMRMFPQRVRSAVLQGVVMPGANAPTEFANDFQAALEGVIADCAAEPACNRAFPRLADEARAVQERVRRGPVTATYLDPQTGPVQLTLSRGTVAETLRKMLYAPGTARLLPLTVHRAAGGDFGPLARMAVSDRRMMQSGMDWGLFLAVTCAEDAPGVDTAAARRSDETTLLGGYRVRQAVAACEGWPRGPLPAGYHQPVRSDAPVLILSGQRDPATPPRWGHAAAAHMPNAVHLVIPHAGHAYGGMPGSECVDALVVRFLDTADPRSVDRSCVERVKRPPFVLADEQPVAVDAAELGKLAGSYASADPPLLMTIEPVAAGLRAQLAGGGTILMVPLSPTRFLPEGWPAGTGVEFTLANGMVTEVVVATPEGMTLRFKPARS